MSETTPARSQPDDSCISERSQLTRTVHCNVGVIHNYMTCWSLASNNEQKNVGFHQKPRTTKTDGWLALP